MLYAIISQDVENSGPLRAKGREAHIGRLQDLIDDGRLVIAGPFPQIDSPDPGPAGWSGSLVVAEFDSLDDAQAWASQDPYLETGAYKKVDVCPFKQVLP